MALYKRGRVWWYSFVFNGEHIQESTKQRNLHVARQIEAARRTQLAKAEVGIKDLPKSDRSTTVSDLLDRLWARYKGTRKENGEAFSQLQRTRREFGSKAADALTSEDIDAWIDRQRLKGLANKTINDLTGTLTTAYRNAKLTPPRIRKLEVDNVRMGFFSPADFHAVHARLPEHVRDFTLFAYLTGWRFGSIASLRWQDIDLESGEIDLPGKYTKNNEPLKMPLEGELASVLARRKEARAVKTSNGTLISAFVFHRDDQPVGQFRKTWMRACIEAGQGKMVCSRCKRESAALRCPKCETKTRYCGRIFHDLRRTAARDRIRSGVAESVAMKITGHKTNSIFQRYNITDTDDVREALRSVGKYRADQEQKIRAISK